MDASTAFAFVLNAETCQKYVGPRILAQQTQVSLCLSFTLALFWVFCSLCIYFSFLHSYFYFLLVCNEYSFHNF